MIKLENYSKTYRKDKGIKDISITFEKGNIYGLVGPNGSGKTTLLNSITGFTKGQGLISVNGNAHRDTFLEDISYMTDGEIIVGGSIKDAARIGDILCEDFSGELFLDYIEKFGIDKKTKYLKLSKGQKMSLKVAFTLARTTPIYIFDEPLSGIDIITRDVIMNDILEKASDESLIIISSHELHDLDNKVDKVVFLNEGKILEVSTLDDLKDEFGKELSEIYISKFTKEATEQSQAK